MEPATPALGYGAAFIYGLIQGVTEFLPISSDGHLKLAHRLGVGALPADLELAFDVLLHAGTLIAIAVAFRKEIAAAFGRRATFYAAALISMVPTGLAGLAGKRAVLWAGERYWAIGLCYAFTAVLLYTAQKIARSRPAPPSTPLDVRAALDSVTLKQAALVGGLQVLALLPGVSRSGTTVAGGLIGGMSPALAVSYSFLIGTPLIAAAVSLDAVGGGFAALEATVGAGPLLVGFVTSLAAGLLSIAALRLVVGKNGLHWFAAYCALIAAACFALELA